MALKLSADYLFTRQEHEAATTTTSVSDPDIEKPPLVEELAIPSVSDLHKAGVRFKATTNGNVSTVSFDSNSDSCVFGCGFVDGDVGVEIFVEESRFVRDGER
ncbi:PREDICTED: putative UPF0481 protein At3g02645 isoform X1 [Camelina sativa]|uniref:UPF0481 protein At3g02645 isoform X1 n=1 Tax=Camelina sativa TaxID=90675 RepID=A0ABM0U299_CAMSA|nr:PREDICTED: putative UPF0481 protein At3g02645 isoform X1 [Camelina sativa]